MQSAYKKVTGEVLVEFYHSNKKNNRWVPSSLEIGTEQGQRWVLSVTAKSKCQTYKLSGNVTKIYNAFAHEGKSSIQLKLPTVVIFVRGADPQELMSFLVFLDEIYKNAEYVPKEESGDETEEEMNSQNE